MIISDFELEPPTKLRKLIQLDVGGLVVVTVIITQ